MPSVIHEGDEFTDLPEAPNAHKPPWYFTKQDEKDGGLGPCPQTRFPRNKISRSCAERKIVYARMCTEIHV